MQVEEGMSPFASCSWVTGRVRVHRHEAVPRRSTGQPTVGTWPWRGSCLSSTLIHRNATTTAPVLYTRQGGSVIILTFSATHAASNKTIYLCVCVCVCRLLNKAMWRSASCCWSIVLPYRHKGTRSHAHPSILCQQIAHCNSSFITHKMMGLPLTWAVTRPATCHR